MTSAHPEGPPEEAVAPAVDQPARRFGDPVPFGPRPAHLHQPWRRFVAAGELVLTVVAVLLAVWCWRRGVTVIDFAAADGQPAVRSTRYVGSWLSAAVGLGTLAALLTLDAGRQFRLGLRATRP